MKTRLLFFAVLFTTSALLVSAQPPRPTGKGEGRVAVTPEMRAERMATKLALTDAQKAKVLELFKKEEVKKASLKEELKAQREKNEALSDAQKEKMAAFRKAQDAELEKIIGKEKMTQLQAERAGQMQKMKENHGRGQLEGRPEANAATLKAKFTPEKRAERMKVELGLSDAEKDALVQLFNSQQNKVAEERKQKMELMKKAQDADIEKIIGKEKMAKYNELRKEKLEKAKKLRKD